MKLTVDELLQLVHDAIVTESDSFGKKAALRRLTRLRLNIAPMSHLKVDIPKPAMSEEAEELLKNSPKAEAGPSKPEESPVVAKKPRRKRRATHISAGDPIEYNTDDASAQTNEEV